MRAGEALGELEVLPAALARETGTKGANVLFVETITGAQVLGDLLHEFVRDPLCAHAPSVRPVNCGE